MKPLHILDRSQAPSLASLSAKALPPIQTVQLSSGVPVHLVRFGTQPVGELQLIYRGGHSYEPKPGLDTAMLKMLTEGSRHRDSQALAEALDAQGAFVQTSPGYEVSAVSLSVLSRRFAAALKVVRELIYEPAFAEEEWSRYQQRTRQALAVEQQRTSYHARRGFVRMAYGEQHPYASVLGLSELDAISRTDLVDYHGQLFAGGPMAILVAGNFDADEVLRALDTELPMAPAPDAGASRAASMQPSPTSGRHHLPLPGLMQATLRIGYGDDGRFRRTAPDYAPMRLLTTVLGGYFGSRLMSNIREEKGYTYGIHAQWSAMRYGGHMLIGTDVANAFVEPTLREVRLELDRLCQDLIPANELQTARNYLLGRMLSEQETPFQVADILKNQLVNGLTPSEYTALFERIQATTAEELRNLAQAYFRPERLLEVISGETG